MTRCGVVPACFLCGEPDSILVRCTDCHEAVCTHCLRIEDPPTCRTCAHRCGDCNGDGEVYVRGHQHAYETTPCSSCGETGWVPYPVYLEQIDSLRGVE